MKGTPTAGVVLHWVRPVAKIDFGGCGTPRKWTFWTQKVDFFKPHPPCPPSKTLFLAHFVAKSGPFGRFGGCVAPPAPPWLRACIGSSSPDGGSKIRRVIVSIPSIQIPHVQKSVAVQWPNREIPGPQNTQDWHHFTRTSSSTHS